MTNEFDDYTDKELLNAFAICLDEGWSALSKDYLKEINRRGISLVEDKNGTTRK